jgi:hypothetical protein
MYIVEALLELQVSVEEAPWAMDVGERETEQVGGVVQVMETDPFVPLV